MLKINASRSFMGILTRRKLSENAWGNNRAQVLLHKAPWQHQRHDACRMLHPSNLHLAAVSEGLLNFGQLEWAPRFPKCTSRGPRMNAGNHSPSSSGSSADAPLSSLSEYASTVPSLSPLTPSLPPPVGLAPPAGSFGTFGVRMRMPPVRF